jgi:pyrroline-5-carboxylate reductase
MISFCQFGAGRIGAIHAANIAAHPEARLNTIVETDRAAAERLAGPYGAVLRDQAEALADPAIDAVVIASRPTPMPIWSKRRPAPARQSSARSRSISTVGARQLVPPWRKNAGCP